MSLVLLPAAPLHAQTAAVSSLADYQGPRYPGGPDSLRALLYRSTRLASPAPTGHALVLFELAPDGRPTNFKLVTPPGPINLVLLRAAGAAVDYLQEHMLPWQPAAPVQEAKPITEPAQSGLILDFSDLSMGARPYSYAEQQPQFPTIEKLMGARLNNLDPPITDPVKRAAYISSAKGLVHYAQWQVRYPAEALRYQQEGRVWASFEVSETGAIEHAEILGTSGRALDAEVLRVVKRLPPAAVPAQLRGQPVRVHYVLPITFKIQ